MAHVQTMVLIGEAEFTQIETISKCQEDYAVAITADNMKEIIHSQKIRHYWC